MRRYFGGFGKVAGFVGLALALLVAGSPVVLAVDVNNFVIKDYQVDMVLSKDGEQRSKLETTETITAIFPDFDQNHGIERSLVNEYDGHQTNLKIESVTRPDGSPWHYEINSANILRIGDRETYVRGEQTFIVKYSQRDVTKYFAGENIEEFYWDAIGTEWRVPIETARISLVMSGDLANSATGSISCYRGAFGSSQACQFTEQTDESGQKSIIVQEQNLELSQGITLAIGFKYGTFAGYQPTFLEKILPTLIMANWISTPIVIGLGIIMTLRQSRVAQTPEIKRVLEQAVVPQYIPPEEYSVLDSSKVYYSSMENRAMPGHIIDWAVRHFVVLKQTRESSIFRKAQYNIEVINEFPEKSRLSTLVEDIFEKIPGVGSTVTTQSLQKRTSSLVNAFHKQDKVILESDLYSANEQATAFANKAGLISLVIGFITFTVPTIMLAIYMFNLKGRKFYSQKGAELKNYLDGLKLYISVAEEERLKMLQSPETAEKVGDVVSDKGARITLYERVLPYAILFGQEKEWAKQLGDLYSETNQSPTWSSSLAGFSTASFVNNLGSFTGNISSASSYSSSSSGSSGGGSSGGGGGGGGGGGW